MAMIAFRLRRAVALARVFSTISSSSANGFLRKSAFSSVPPVYRLLRGLNEPSPLSRCQIARFRACSTTDEDNLWLVTMKFPDPQPSREEKIDTFIKTLAKIIGSEEDAKKSIYALSTTLYTGFMCEIPQELAEKIKSEPGVDVVIPSIKKLYGIGDKYVNGEIIPDVPPPSNSRAGGKYSDRPRNRRRIPMERNDIQMPRDSLSEAVGVDTMQTGRGPVMGDRQDDRAAMSGDRQDHMKEMDGRGPISGERQDNRPPSMDGRAQDYGLPPRDRRAQDYGPPPTDGRAQDYGLPPRGGRGPDYGTPMDGKGPDYGTSMDGRGPDYRTPMDGRGLDYRTPIGGRGPDYRTPMEGRGSDNRTSMDRRGPDCRTTVGGRGPNYSTPMEGRGPDFRTPMDGRGPDYRTSTGGRGPMPSGDQQYYRPPTMDATSNQQASPMSGRGPMPLVEQIQGQQAGTLGNQERETLEEGQRESFPWPMEGTN